MIDRYYYLKQGCSKAGVSLFPQHKRKWPQVVPEEIYISY